MATNYEVEMPRGRLAEWLAGPLRKNRRIYVKVGLAAAMINFFALVTSLFTMTVYDRVVPNSAFDSLVGLSIGLGIVLIFDFVLKLVRALPRLQLLVSALLKSIPSMGYVSVLLGMLFYLYGVAATHLFGANDPVHFGSLERSLLTLFQVVTLDGSMVLR